MIEVVENNQANDNMINDKKQYARPVYVFNSSETGWKSIVGNRDKGAATSLLMQANYQKVSWDIWAITFT